MNVSLVSQVGKSIVAEVSKAIVGKEESVTQAVLALLCGGHILIEDVPGVGKTTLAKALAKSIGGEFRRVQFTPDLLPSDITGSSIFDQKSGEFDFRPGPLFSNVVLVDEVNRATPKTQSALLEAMEEKQVSSDGVTRELPKPFFVLATQNNIEMTGTYPLPEAQLDRFFARVTIGYPSREAEAEILVTQQISGAIQDVKEATSRDELIEAQRIVREVFVHENIREYIVDIVRATRESSQLVIGSSPRGSLYLMLGAQAHAAMDNRDFVLPDDVKAIAALVLSHRIILRGEVRARGSEGKDVIDQILTTAAAPTAVTA